MTLSHGDAFEPVLTTHLGALRLATPKLRQGSFFPSWLGRQGPLLYALFTPDPSPPARSMP